MPKVSIIIPVYNVEKFLRKCLDSVINQTLEDIEIICINDGSTDNCYQILEEYAKKDKRIVLFDQKNQGVSVARNKGIEIASSEYIMFVDPDDWLELNAIETAYKLISDKKVDILNFGYYFYDNGDIFSGATNKFLEANENNSKFSNDDLINLTHTIWDKIYRKNFIADKKILFPKGIRITEDGYFNLLCLIEGAIWKTIKQPLYYYRIDRKDSAIQQTQKLIFDEFDALSHFVHSKAYDKAPEEIKILALNKFMGGFIYNYNRKRSEANLLLMKQITQVRSKISKLIPKNLLDKVDNYKNLKKCSLTTLILHSIFSLKNERKGNTKVKILTILGIKFKCFKRTIK